MLKRLVEFAIKKYIELTRHKCYLVVYVLAGQTDKQITSIVKCDPMEIIEAVREDAGNDGVNFKTILNVMPL